MKIGLKRSQAGIQKLRRHVDGGNFKIDKPISRNAKHAARLRASWGSQLRAAGTANQVIQTSALKAFHIVIVSRDVDIHVPLLQNWQQFTAKLLNAPFVNVVA